LILVLELACSAAFFVPALRLLAAHPSSHADADEATALQDFMLAALKSFVRRYNVQCAEIADRIAGEVLGAEGVPQELKAVVEAQLSL
jgi:hypothetical protein